MAEMHGDAMSLGKNETRKAMSAVEGIRVDFDLSVRGCDRH